MFEKCPYHAAPDPLEFAPPYILPSGRFFCPTCRQEFDKGQGGGSHSYCGACVNFVREKFGVPPVEKRREVILP